MARTGLRMMPTFPLPPLKFRTAGFPRYGFKAGLSDEAFPGTLVCHRPSCSLLPSRFPALCQGRCAYGHLRTSGLSALPQGPSLRSGLFCPSPSTLTRPHPPHSQAHPDFTVLSAYTRCLRCAYSHMPRRPATGSELSLMLFHNRSPSETPGNFSAAYTQYLAENAGLQLQIKVSAFPLSSHSDSGEGDCFEA